MGTVEDISKDDFSALLEESFSQSDVLEGTVVEGIVTSIEKDMAIIDVGLKMEGRIPIKEFAFDGPPVDVGSRVTVYIERIENLLGEAVLSREKARREATWGRLASAFASKEKINGKILRQIKGGYAVDLEGTMAFLPSSQVDIRPISDIRPLLNQEQPFRILKMDKRRENIVVSRRVILEESRAKQRSELVKNLTEGQIIEGTVKNITDYGAFVDLGGVDGLLHVTDISWGRVKKPADIFSVGDSVKVQVIRINQETDRISLGMKQLKTNPWDGIENRYPVGKKFKGRVTNIADYGAFVELEPGIEGLVHVSEMSWTKKNLHPNKIVSQDEEIDVMVLEVDPVKRRISLGHKQVLENPWKTFAETHSVGDIIEGEIKNKTEFGLFVGLNDQIDGMVHLSDLDWERPGEQILGEYNRGDMVRAIVLDVDVEKERVSLGIKQTTPDPFAVAASDKGIKKGATVACEVLEVREDGVLVRVCDTDFDVFIVRSELAYERAEQDPSRFSIGDKLEARVTQFDKKARRLQLSIKALQIAEEKKAVADYGSSSEAGSALGNILGAAFEKSAEEIQKTSGDSSSSEGTEEEGKG